MSEKIAISVKNVSKTFKLPHERHGSLKSAFLSGLKKRTTYEKQEVLKDISFEIKKGEFFGIVGRNGSGKSTLLKLLAGIYSPDKGEIQIEGKLTPFIELGVGFNPELSGRENVFLNGALLGFDRKQMEAMYDEIVEFAELEKFMDQKLKNYSSGMQVRLAFSIAIKAESDVYLFDEVLAVGDERFQQKCLKFFREMKKKKRTIVFVSHDMKMVEQFCDRAILLDKGNIVEEGRVNRIIARYINLNREPGKPEAESSLFNAVETGIKLLKIIIRDEEGNKTKRIVHGKYSRIEFVLQAQQTIEDILAGISIKPENNTVSITGGRFEGSFTKPHIKKGEKFSIETNFLASLNNGVHYVSIAIKDKSKAETYLQAYEATSFQVIDYIGPDCVSILQNDTKLLSGTRKTIDE